MHLLARGVERRADPGRDQQRPGPAQRQARRRGGRGGDRRRVRARPAVHPGRRDHQGGVGDDRTRRRRPNDAAGYFELGEPIADTKAPGGPIETALGDPRVRGADRQPGQPPPAVDHRGRHRAGRRVGRGHPGRGRLRGEVVLLPGLPAPGALDRRAGRDQRGQELQGRRRLGAPAVLRHHQGRRLPLPGVQRVPAGRGEPEHHRPVRGPGCAVRPGVRRAAGQPLVRRGAGLAHVLRPRADRPAAAARRLPGPGTPGRGGHGALLHPPRDARADRGRRPGPRDHRPGHGHRRDRDLLRRRGGARLRRLRQRVLPVHQRDGLQRHRDLAGAPQGRLHGQPLLHPDPPDLHPGHRRPPVEADADERVAAQRRPDLGAAEGGRLRQGPARDRRGGPRLLPGADLPRLRQPGPPRHRLPAGQEHVRRGPRRRPRGRRRAPRRLPGLHRRHRTARPAGDRGQVRQPLRHVRPDHRRGPVPGPDADLPGRALRDGRAVGGLRPAVHDPRTVRHRRGELLRPRREPARRLGADAGPGRRLLRAVQHDPRLPGRRPVREGPRGPSGGASRPSSRCASRIEQAAGGGRHPQRRLLPPRARPHHVGVLRHGTHRRRACARRST